MISLIQEIRDRGDLHIIVSSHLLRDVEECCDEVLILKNGSIAAFCNLEEERRANKRFLEMETRGETNGTFLAAMEKLIAAVEAMPPPLPPTRAKTAS